MEDSESFFADKINARSTITLIEKSCLPGRSRVNIVWERLAKVFNKFLVNIAPNLKITTVHGCDTDFIAADDQDRNAFNKFRNHQVSLWQRTRKKNDQSPVTYDDAFNSWHCKSVSAIWYSN